jgi:hypothetical protein
MKRCAVLIGTPEMNNRLPGLSPPPIGVSYGTGCMGQFTLSRVCGGALT